MIIFFSGTGNTRIVAEQLSHLLGDEKIVDLRGENLFDPLSCRISATGEQRIIWMFPTYSWGVPPVMVRFIREATVDGAETAKHYLVTTCGDDIGNMPRQWRRLMRRHGWQTANAYSVQMPNTYVLMKGFDVDAEDVAAAKLAAAPAAVKHIAEAIVADKPGDEVVAGSWAWIKSTIIYRWFVRFCMSPKPFRANDRCISCQRCVKVCPMNNIVMQGDTPQWHQRCALCLACYHVCPTAAVQYGSATRHKGRYNIK